MSKRFWLIVTSAIAVSSTIANVEHIREIRQLKATIVGLKAEIEINKSIELARTSQLGATFDFGEYRGLPVQLVVDPDGRIVLEIAFSIHNPDVLADPRGDYLDYLKQQVEVSRTSQGVHLRNGMTMRLEGFPVWGPHERLGPDGSAKRLYFGESATFNGQTIVIRGAPNRPVGFYPYSL